MEDPGYDNDGIWCHVHLQANLKAMLATKLPAIPEEHDLMVSVLKQKGTGRNY